MDFSRQMASSLEIVQVLPRRLLLDTPGVAATVPMLRGVWGAALHDLDQAVYAAVFAPNDEPQIPRHSQPPPARSRPLHRAGMALVSSAHSDVPSPPPASPGGTAVASYVLRPAPPDPQFAPALEWILIGDALQHDFTLCRAWDIASGMGLGPQRQRFHLRRTVALRPDGQTTDQSPPWPLSEARWLGWTCENATDEPGEPASIRLCELAPDQPCRMVFPAPLRLMFRKQLIATPTLADIVVAACRRVKPYLPIGQHPAWDQLSRQALPLARATPAGSWQGERLDLRRYSARQHAELELRGVTGWLDLPRGPGDLWPLLAAAQWLHLGKGTVMGLGEMKVEG